MYRADLLLALEKSAILVACALALALFVYLSLVFRVVGQPGRDDRIGAATGAAFVFALLGIVTGFTMGASRVAVVANIVPAALTFIGGLALWIVTRETKEATPPHPGQVVAVACSVTSFTLMLFFGMVLGAFERNRAEYEARSQDLDHARMIREAEVEFLVNAYRATLGLGPRDFSPAAGN